MEGRHRLPRGKKGSLVCGQMFVMMIQAALQWLLGARRRCDGEVIGRGGQLECGCLTQGVCICSNQKPERCSNRVKAPVPKPKRIHSAPLRTSDRTASDAGSLMAGAGAKGGIQVGGCVEEMSMS
jgi:hypothetical protein